MSKIKVAIAEDHEKFREAFVDFLKIKNEFDIIIEAENGSDLIAKLKEKTPDVILLDIQMPVMNGFEAAKIIQNQYPEIKIIVFTYFDNISNIIEMFKIGIRSFVNKKEAEDMPRIIKIVGLGGSYYPDEVAQSLQQFMLSPSANMFEEHKIEYPFKISLTLQEGRIVQLLKIGKTSKEIALQMMLTVKTVRTYRERFLKKTKTKNVDELLNVCFET
jgi:two-component system, NarL family, response regulator DegU